MCIWEGKLRGICCDCRELKEHSCVVLFPVAGVRGWEEKTSRHRSQRDVWSIVCTETNRRRSLGTIWGQGSVIILSPQVVSCQLAFRKQVGSILWWRRSLCFSCKNLSHFCFVSTPWNLEFKKCPSADKLLPQLMGWSSVKIFCHFWRCGSFTTRNRASKMLLGLLLFSDWVAPKKFQSFEMCHLFRNETLLLTQCLLTPMAVCDLFWVFKATCVMIYPTRAF